jgi:hypothetical protein
MDAVGGTMAKDSLVPPMHHLGGVREMQERYL